MECKCLTGGLHVDGTCLVCYRPEPTSRAYSFVSQFDGSTRTAFAATLREATARLPWPRLHRWRHV